MINYKSLIAYLGQGKYREYPKQPAGSRFIVDPTNSHNIHEWDLEKLKPYIVENSNRKHIGITGQGKYYTLHEKGNSFELVEHEASNANELSTGGYAYVPVFDTKNNIMIYVKNLDRPQFAKKKNDILDYLDANL